MKKVYGTYNPPMPLEEAREWLYEVQRKALEESLILPDNPGYLEAVRTFKATTVAIHALTLAEIFDDPSGLIKNPG